MALTGRSIRQPAALGLALVAVFSLFSGAVFYLLTGLPVSKAFFEELASDERLGRYIADRIVSRYATASAVSRAVIRRIVRVKISRMIRTEFYESWKRSMQNSNTGSLVLSTTALKRGFGSGAALVPALRKELAALPAQISFYRLIGLKTRERELLRRFSSVYKAVSGYRMLVLLVPFLLLGAAFILAQRRFPLLTSVSFVGSVLLLTLFLFILVFRQQVTGLALAVLAQFSRNTLVERAVVRCAMHAAAVKLIFLSLGFGLFSFLTLLLTRFRTDAPPGGGALRSTTGAMSLR